MGVINPGLIRSGSKARSGIVDTMQNIALGFDSVGNVDALKAASSFSLATGFSATGAIGLAGAVGAGAGVVSGVMDGTGPIDGGLGGLATGVLASAAVVGGAVMTKQGRKIVDRVGKGRFKGDWEKKTGFANSIIDKKYVETGGAGDSWSNFAKDIYSNSTAKPAKTGSNLGTSTKVKPLQQATAGANSGSVAETIAQKAARLSNENRQRLETAMKRQRGDYGRQTRSKVKETVNRSDIYEKMEKDRVKRSNSAKKGAMTRAANKSAKKQQEEAALANRSNNDSYLEAERQAAENRASYRFDMLQNLQESESRSQIPLPITTMKQGNATQVVNPSALNQQQRAEQTNNFFKKIRMKPGTVGNLGAQAAQQAGRTDADALLQGAFSRQVRNDQIARQEAKKRENISMQTQKISGIWNQIKQANDKI